MKFVLLAAAAVLAAPVMAQTADQTAPTDQSSPPADQATMPADQGQTGTTMTSPEPATQSAPMAPTGQAGTATGGDPVGGYQPSAPPMQGSAQPGQQVTFQQAPSPDQAYPAPAPLAKYPVCKKGQYDKCIQRGGR